MASHLSSHTSTNSPKKLSFTQHSISSSTSLSTDATQMTESDTYEPSALRALDNNVNMPCILCHRLYEPNSDPVVSDKDDPSILDLTTSAQNGCTGCFHLSNKPTSNLGFRRPISPGNFTSYSSKVGPLGDNNDSCRPLDRFLHTLQSVHRRVLRPILVRKSPCGDLRPWWMSVEYIIPNTINSMVRSYQIDWFKSSYPSDPTCSGLLIVNAKLVNTQP
jgi:hypothetical protein